MVKQLQLLFSIRKPPPTYLVATTLLAASVVSNGHCFFPLEIFFFVKIDLIILSFTSVSVPRSIQASQVSTLDARR